jgi:hypothetical protein
MRRSVLALGASVFALALTAGPAAAEPQTVDNSTGAAQVGAVAVDAPVRVASDGDSQTAGASAGGPQATGDSTGSAQVTSVDADAPVRVLSDGDDAEAGTTASGGEQSSADSNGSAQMGSAEASAPVRVLSDGDNAGAETATSEPQSTGDSTGSAQVGSPAASAPVQVLSDGDNAGAAAGAGDAEQTTSGSTAAAQLGSPRLFAPARALSAGGFNGDDGTGEGGTGGEGSPQASPLTDDESTGPLEDTPEGGSGLEDGGSTTTETQPALQFVSGGAGPDTDVADTGAQGLETLGVAQLGDLPLTGLGLFALVASGLWLVGGGLALRLVPGGRRR